MARCFIFGSYKQQKRVRVSVPSTQANLNNRQEIEPPWVMHPGFSPSDGFWRQSGEAWFHYVWNPFWNTLSVSEKEEYLLRWKVPEEWCLFCPQINPGYAAWLDSLDADEKV